MGSFKYATEIGSYGDDTRLSIDLSIKGGLNKEDHETLRDAFNTIEDLVQKYHEPKPQVPKINKG